MAARSPVFIGSSPALDRYRSPSITPIDTRHNGSSNDAPSSPGLLSLNASVRTKPPTLKSGSKAQQVPTGANKGFSTAASLWAGHREEGGAAQDGGRRSEGEHQVESNGERPLAKGTGKLTRPSKASISTKKVVEPITASKHDSLSTEPAAQSPKLPSILPGRKSTTVAEEAAKPHAARRPSLSLSQYSFDADTMPPPVEAPRTEAQITKKPGKKRAVKGIETGSGTAAAKKPRKGKTNSEIIILNSDEPEHIATGLKEPDHLQALELPTETAPKVRKPRVKKAKEKGEDKVLDTTTKKSKTPKKPKASTGLAAETAEKSGYFGAKPAGNASRTSTLPSVPVEDTSNALQDVNSAAEAALPAEMAPRRRRSWTPVKDSFKDPESNKDLAMGTQEPDKNLARVSMSELLSNFSYSAKDVAAFPWAADGEAMTKRRRIELSDTPAVGHPVQLPPTKISAKAAKPSKLPKPPKAHPKKAQTITALATAAYQPAKEPPPAQSAVSSFFTPRLLDPAKQPTEDAKATPAAAAKPKKPRKPRAKPAVNEDGTAKKKAAKPKAKPKFNPADYRSPLLSPTGARKQLQAQDFVFGTSSQLAVDESAAFIRAMQLAVSESEALASGCSMRTAAQAASQIEASPAEKSCIKVPTAPHGTCLSVEQAERELWCVSARDDKGATLAPEEMALDEHLLQDLEAKPELPLPSITLAPAAGANDVEPKYRTPVRDTVDLSLSSPAAALPLEKEMTARNNGEAPESPSSRVFMDISLTSSVADPDCANSAPAVLADLNQPLVQEIQATEPQVAHGDEDWMLLRSDDSVLLPQQEYYSDKPTVVTKTVTKDHARAVSSLTRSSLPADKLLSPVAMRSALQTLDANASMTARGFSAKSDSTGQARTFTATASDPAPMAKVSKPRGRPRKADIEIPSGPPSAKRARDRPRKASPTDASLAPSPKRPRGRPRKDAALAGEPVARPPKEKGKQPTSLSQPSAQSEWANIDDISDPEPLTTPSPARRRASTSPAARQLDFAAPASPALTPRAKASSAYSNFKATDPEWQTVHPKLYPAITHTIRSTPPSTSLDKPSWHEKILLYDPIVLEDFTAWLNSQGLRTDISRIKPKPKTKGRKKKDAPGEPVGEEWEVFREELKPWMVQKWCEEHSVCCLWKEGLRGGVRGNY